MSSTSSSPSLCFPDDLPLGQPSGSDDSLPDVYNTPFSGVNPVASSSALTNDDDDDDEVALVEVSTSNGIENLSFDDVELSDDEINKVSKYKGEIQYTRIVKIGSHPIAKINIESLRSFCKNNGLLEVRKVSKKAICDKIVYAIVNPDQFAKEVADAAEAKKKVPPPKIALKTTNRKRFINIMFHDDIRHKLMTRGEVLTRQTGLDEGKKTDQDLFQLIADEYNDGNKTIYLIDEVPEANFRKDPSSFSPITWHKAKDVFKSMSNEYEKIRKDWKKSGNHSSLEQLQREGVDLSLYEPDPDDTTNTQFVLKFERFSQSNKAMLYLHKLVYRFPGFFEKFVGNLYKGVYRDSEGFYGTHDDNGLDTDCAESTAYRRRAKARQEKEKQEKENQYYESVFKKNKALVEAVARENTLKELQVEQEKMKFRFLKADRKRNLRSAFIESIKENGDDMDMATAKKMAKERIDRFKKKIESPIPDNPFLNIMNSAEKEDDPDSQESLLQELYDLDN